MSKQLIKQELYSYSVNDLLLLARYYNINIRGIFAQALTQKISLKAQMLSDIPCEESNDDFCSCISDWLLSLPRDKLPYNGDANQALSNRDTLAHTLILGWYKMHNDPEFANNRLQIASEHGDTKIVELLLKNPRVDPSANDNLAIHVASQNGHSEVVELLLQDPRVDPAARDNFAIRVASQYGHYEVVKLLLQDPRVDPTANDNNAVDMAIRNCYRETAKLLLTDPRVARHRRGES